MHLALVLLACASEAPAPAAAPAPAPAVPAAAAPAPAAFRQVDAAQLDADRKAGKVPVLVDVRTAEEYAGGHVPGAVNIPLDQLASRTAELDSFKAGDVYLICQSGRRSTQASGMLAEQGFHAVNVSGGTGGWKAAGYPVE